MPNPDAAKHLAALRATRTTTAGKDYPAQVLTYDEVMAVIGKCSLKAKSGIRNRALFTLLYRSGIRISEALALKPGDINMEDHSLRILETKTGKPQTRGFHPSADDALARWKETRKGLGIRNGSFFCTLHGGDLSAAQVRNTLHRLAAKAGVDKRIHPHIFRHSFAWELERRNTPITTISKLLGHSSIAVTARYLEHLTNLEAVKALADVDLPPLEPK